MSYERTVTVDLPHGDAVERVEIGPIAGEAEQHLTAVLSTLPTTD